MADKYACYRELEMGERLGVDYRIVRRERPGAVAILAPHGGCIEPGTSEIAGAIAGESYSLYCFEGLMPGRPHGELHITSTNFDEPVARELVAVADIVVTVHGRSDALDTETAWLGGLDLELRNAMQSTLHSAGFGALSEGHRFQARHPRNLTNRGRRNGGVQLELPRTLRDRLRGDALLLIRFADAVREAIQACSGGER